MAKENYKYRPLNVDFKESSFMKNIFDKINLFIKSHGSLIFAMLSLMCILILGSNTLMTVPYKNLKDLLVLIFAVIRMISVTKFLKDTLWLLLFYSKKSPKYSTRILWECYKVKFVLGFAFFTTSVIVCYMGNDHLSDLTRNILQFSNVFILVVFIYDLISLVSSKSPDANKKTIGHCIAMGYYLGFLKLAIPAGKDSSEPDIARRMEAKEEQLDCYRFRMKKLFILVPYSCHITDDLQNFNLEDINFESLEGNGDLKSRKIDRCGTKARVYNSTVYQIYDMENEQHYYCCAGVATTVQTLYEMVNNTKTNCNMTSSDLNEERSNFVTSLQEIFEEDTEVGNLCEIIEFDDRNETGERVKLSEVILNRIRQIERKEMIPIPLIEMQS